MAESQSNQTVINPEESVRELAHKKWQQAGCPAGDGAEFWYAAEEELAKKELVREKPRAK